MELPQTDLKLFKGKVKDVLLEMISCKEHMLQNYPFEDNKERDAQKELKKVKVKFEKFKEELKTFSQEAKDKAKPELKRFES
jgi:hypothetical protein